MSAKGSLTRGLRVGDAVHKEFEIRAATTGDLLDAETDAPVDHRLAFRAALLARQVVKLGTLSGPLDFKLLRGLHPADFDELSRAQQQADEEGNAEPSSSSPSI